ncbi:unnamed protein product [Rhizophagus irregularis]|nr:unnamed protein product [Rhizophagus irregularis]CAB4441003.1 unnamed protein product [Rhizophagus irregularis]
MGRVWLSLFLLFVHSRCRSELEVTCLEEDDEKCGLYEHKCLIKSKNLSLNFGQKYKKKLQTSNVLISASTKYA